MPSIFNSIRHSESNDMTRKWAYEIAGYTVSHFVAVSMYHLTMAPGGILGHQELATIQNQCLVILKALGIFP